MLNKLAPKFTVVTVTYNAESTIEDTIQSVISQTYHNVEYIIIDGASKDRTMEIVAKYSDRIKTVISEPDKGLYDAMNKGMAMATGDYICFLNSGDCFHEYDTLWDVVHNLQRKNELPDIIYGETAIVNSEGHFMHMRRLSSPETLNWKSFRHGMLVCHQAFYARLDIARRTPYDLRYRFSADVDWCIRVMKEAERMGLPLVNVHATVADYQREGQTTKYHRASLIERFNVMRRHYGLPVTLAMHAWFVVRNVLKKHGKAVN